jgi:hypothetical protein
MLLTIFFLLPDMNVLLSLVSRAMLHGRVGLGDGDRPLPNNRSELPMAVYTPPPGSQELRKGNTPTIDWDFPFADQNRNSTGFWPNLKTE